MANKITFYGHSAFRIKTGTGLRIWIDPWLENPLAPEIRAEDKDADLVLVTHAHGDHLGNCLELAKSSSCEVVAIHEIQQYLLAKGLPNVTGMNIGGSYRTKGVEITMVEAIHSSSIQEGHELAYGGEAAGFVIRLEDNCTIYHAGDTALFGDMALIGELYRPDIALLPIGSHYVMGPREAAYSVKLLGVDKVIPMHYGSFPVLTGTVDMFREELNKIGLDVNVIALEPGETYDL